MSSTFHTANSDFLSSFLISDDGYHTLPATSSVDLVSASSLVSMLFGATSGILIVVVVVIVVAIVVMMVVFE